MNIFLNIYIMIYELVPAARKQSIKNIYQTFIILLFIEALIIKKYSMIIINTV